MSSDLIRRALAALEYHQAQTRPIHETQETIEALRDALEAAPFPTIDMGHGKYEVGAGKHAGLPCIAFGKNGSGVVGELITMEPRQMTVDETVLVITFANLMGLEVLQDKVDEVREGFFAGERLVLPGVGVSHG